MRWASSRRRRGKRSISLAVFFAPKAGIPEDPVTGSAHCMLVPYWERQLGKRHLEARQLSQRGGLLRCEAAGERVKIGGQATLYLIGTIELP